jgi:hypothetical protein
MTEPGTILHTAAETIGQRAADRDVEAERSMKGTVEAFNAIHGTNLTESQGWSFMTLLKMKRSFTGDRFREDDFVDEAAYTALRAESRDREITEANTERVRVELLDKALNNPS